MSRRDEQPEDYLETRLDVAEDEIVRLRKWRHEMASEKMSVVLLSERLTLLRDDVAGGKLTMREIVQRIEVIEAKCREYDKERSMAAKLFWPIVIALAIAAAMAVVTVLLRIA